MLYKYDKSKNAIIQLDDTTFSAERLTEVGNIEEWIRKNPGILSEDEDDDLIIFGQQAQSTTRKRVDLLGVDRFGNVIIIELKRDLAEVMTDFQAITYASYFVDTGFEEICRLYAKYLKDKKIELGLPDDHNYMEAAETTLRSVCSEINIPDEFNTNQRIILVAGEFSLDLISAVTWLILKGIKIECIKLELYKDQDSIFIHPRRVLPTPDISENIPQMKIDEEKIEKKRAISQKSDWNIEKNYERLNPVLVEYLKSLVDDFGIEPTNATLSGFHLVNGKKKLMISTYIKSKIEFKFSKSKKEDIEKLVQDLGIKTLTVKAKSDVESYGTQNPTPAIDYRTDYGPFDDIKQLCRKWLFE